MQRNNGKLQEEVKEREQVEEELKESEEGYRALFEQAADPIFNVELTTGKISMVNSALLEQSGYSREELIGTRFTNFMPKRYWPMTLALLKDALSGRRTSAKFEVEYYHKSGEIRPIELSATIIKDARGHRLAQCIARDITERKQAEEALEREVNAVGEVARIVTSNLEIDQVYERFAREMKRIVPFDRMTVLLIDEKEITWHVAHRYGTENHGVYEVGTPHPLRGSVMEHVVKHHAAVVSNDLSQDHRFWIFKTFREDGFRSLIQAPLRVKEKVFGAVTLLHQGLGTYGARERRLVETLASHIAPAIENARLFQQVKEARDILQSLLNVSSIIGSSLNSKAKLQRILEEMARMVDADQAVLRVLDEETDSLRLVASAGAHQFVELPSHEGGAGLILETFHSGEKLLVNDYPNHPRAMPYFLEQGLKSVIFLAIKVGDRTLAVAAVHSREINYFTAERVDVLARIADEMAVLLENSGLLQQVDLAQESAHRRSQELEALSRIASILAGPGKFERKASRALEELVCTGQADFATFRVPDKGGRELRLVAKAGSLLKRDTSIPIEGSLLGEAFQEGKALAINDYQHHPGSLQRYKAQGVKSAMLLPVKAVGKTLGTIAVHSNEVNHFTAERIRLLTGICDEMAVLMDNARLMESERQQAQELETIVNAAPVQLYLLEKDMTVRWANRPGQEWFGLEHELVVGKSWYELGLGTPRYQDVHQRVLAGESIDLVGTPAESPEGTRYFDAGYRPIRNTEGEVTAMVMSSTDVTDHIEREERLRESEERYRTLFEESRNAIYITSRGGEFLDANQSTLELLGYTRDELMRTNVRQTYANPDDRGRFVQAIEERGSVKDYELRLRRKDGTEFDSLITSTVRRAKDGTVLGYQSICRDISERKRYEEALRLAQFSIDHAADGVFWAGSDGRFVYANEAACRLYGYSHQELLSMTVYDLSPKVQRESKPVEWAKLRQQGNMTFEIRQCAKDGRVFPVEVAGMHLEFAGREYIFAFVRDLTEKKQLENRLQSLADRDPLTKLLNRRRFQEEMDCGLADAQCRSTSLALLSVDVDQFKYVNDRLGHAAGDRLLRSLAVVLKDSLRHTDIIGRLGGDEFAILLLGSDADHAREVAERLMELVRHHTFSLIRQSVRITVSVGIALYPDHGSTAAELLTRSDQAMYQAKRNGRDLSQLYASDTGRHTRIGSRLRWGKRIREALEKDQFELYCQPIVDLRRGKVAQHELLLRLVSDRGHVTRPGAFLDTAERLGLIHEIDRWVVRRAIRLLADHRRVGRNVRLAINLSGSAFLDDTLAPLIQQESEDAGIDPANLVMEITAISSMADTEKARRFVSTLKEMGFQFGLDDFGMGSPSFYQLKQLPVDYLKIDGVFIRNLPKAATDQHLVKAMAETALALGIKTIAEFVEDEETVELLKGYGVDYAQGYHIGKPQPVRDRWPDVVGDIESQTLVPSVGELRRSN